MLDGPESLVVTDIIQLARDRFISPRYSEAQVAEIMGMLADMTQLMIESFAK